MTMKMSKLALAIGALVMTGGAMAQSLAIGASTANATVVAPIGITAGATLEFGKVISKAHTVTIATDGTRTDSITNTNVKGTPSAATFAVTGEPSFSYTITLPSTFQIFTGSPGTVTSMGVSAFTVAPGAKGTIAGTADLTTGLGAIGTLDTAGKADLNVGAMLTVNASQVAGSYTAPYSVIVAYN